jgi:hypothetical protein
VKDPAAVRRLEAARQAVRAVGAALRAHRLYAAGHATTQQSLLAAQNALRAYVTTYGALRCMTADRGVVFDFSPSPQDDDVLAEFSRALAAAKTTTITFLAGVTADQLAVLLETLHLPRPALNRVGGAGRVLRERGVQSVALEDLGAPAARGADRVNPLLETLRTSPERLAARLDEVAGGDAGRAARMLADIDRTVATWPPARRDEAWTHLATAVAATGPEMRAPLCGAIIRALHEPWAASLASRWPPGLIADIATAESRAPGPPSQEIAAVLGNLHRGVPSVRPPDVGPVDAAARTVARDAVQAVGDAVLTPYAAARFLNVLARLDPVRFAEGLRLVERNAVAAVEAEDINTVARVLIGLAVFARRLPDARAELARGALHHLLTTTVRDLVTKTMAEIDNERHPLRAALAADPEEAVLLLLDLLADEERMPVRRRIVTLLSVLARGQVSLLAPHVVDPRWYVARNVATAMAEMRDPAAVPYLKSALQHQDLRVRKEALAALAAVRTREALTVLTEAQQHPDAATRAAAAHWRKVAAEPEPSP